MIRKFRSWLYGFLPAWAKETILAENAKLKEHNAALRQELREQQSYIDGLERGIRSQRRIIINAGEVKR